MKWSHGAVVLAAILLPSGEALAHALLKNAIPAAGTTVSQAPPALMLTYSEGLEPSFSTVAVTDHSGARVDEGRVRPVAGSPSEITVPLKPLAPGTYTVTWHAVSVDTHKTEGRYQFTVSR